MPCRPDHALFFAPIAAVGFAVNVLGAGTETTGLVQVDKVRSFVARERGGTFKERVDPEFVGVVLERLTPISLSGP